MKLDYILIPENVTRRSRLGHRHKVSPISRAGRRAPGGAKDKATASDKPRAHWESITSRIEAFLKGVNKCVAPQTNTASTGQKDLFNTESFFSKFSRKSAFHRHLLHPDQEAPVVPSRPDTFYLPPSPRTPTVPTAVRRAASCTKGIKVSGSPYNGLRLSTDLVPDRDCAGKNDIKNTSPDLSSSPFDKAGSLGSPRCSIALSNAHCNSREDRNISIPKQRQFSPDLHEVHINQYPPYQSITHPQFFDYDSRLQPQIQPFQNGSSSPHVQEYTPHEPYFDHAFHQHTPIYGWFSNQNIYPYQVPLNWHSEYSHAPGITHLEYSPHQPYFSHY